MKNSNIISSVDDGLYVDANSPGFKSFTNIYNNYYNNDDKNYDGDASQGTGEIFTNPNYDIATYGKGAYLMIPTALQGQGENGSDIGAEVLYRYQGGVLTTTPLWPWPMEDRIFAETGISVTWEANGGLWKTLDGVYTSPSFDFSLSSSGNVSVIQGSTVSCTMTSSLVSGTAQSVSYSTSDLPQGATASFSQTSCLPDCSTTLTIYTSASTPAGTYTVTVTGTGGGIPKATTFYLTVNAPAQTQNTITSMKSSTPVIVDGNLSENAWNQANYVTFSNPSRSDNQVKVFTLYDDDNLYFAFEVTDFQLEALNQSLWSDDGVEIYLDTQNNKSTSMDSNDYHFLTNINDLTSDTSITSKTKTHSTGSGQATGYTQEIKIPFTTLNITPNNQTLGLLLANNDRDPSTSSGQATSSQFDCLNLIETGPYTRPNLWGDIILSSQTVSVDTDPPAPPFGLAIQSQ